MYYDDVQFQTFKSEMITQINIESVLQLIMFILYLIFYHMSYSKDYDCRSTTDHTRRKFSY